MPTIESKGGRTEVDAKISARGNLWRVSAPEYLTYVLWAITPEGHAKNLGEALPGPS